MTDEQIAESYRQQILKIGDEVCSTMITDYYNKFKNQTLYPKEIEFINDKIDGISGYIATIEQQRKNKVNRQNNGLTDGIKLTPDFLNLTGYKNFLEWLYDRKKQIEGEKNNSIMNTIFDLTAYPLTAAGTHPYLYIKKETDFFYVYDGQIGQNKFAYFKINASSEAGEKCDSFYDKYVTKNEHRFSYIEDIQALKSFIEDKAAERLTGLEAYLKYYFEALPIEDKLRNGFYAIQHFEALKDWFNLVLENHNKKNEIHYSTKEIKEAEIRNFTNSKLESVEGYLRTGTMGIISRANAIELFKFRDWLQEQLTALDAPPTHQPPVKNFDSTLTPNQLEKICNLITEIKLFKTPIEIADLTNLFSNNLITPIQVTNNQNLASLFNCLSNAGYITK